MKKLWLVVFPIFLLMSFAVSAGTKWHITFVNNVAGGYFVKISLPPGNADCWQDQTGEIWLKQWGEKYLWNSESDFSGPCSPMIKTGEYVKGFSAAVISGNNYQTPIANFVLTEERQSHSEMWSYRISYAGTSLRISPTTYKHDGECDDLYLTITFTGGEPKGDRIQTGYNFSNASCH